MLVHERHFSIPVIGGTGHAQCNIWSCSLEEVLANRLNRAWMKLLLEILVGLDVRQGL